MSESRQMSAMPLWTWAELCAACDLAAVPGPAIQGICIDSRQARKGIFLSPWLVILDQNSARQEVLAEMAMSLSTAPLAPVPAA